MPSLVSKIGLCLAFLTCCVWYAQSHFYRDPGSVFFDKTRAYKEKYSLHRQEETVNLINQYASSTGSQGQRPGKAGDNPSLCVALMSVKRKNTQYLEYTIGSLLHGLTPEERADLNLRVIIAETDATKHPSWHEEWLWDAVDSLASYNLTAPEDAFLRTMEREDDYSAKGVFDYAYALEDCYGTKAPYIAIFEDDIILADGWLVRTLLHLQKLPPPDEDNSSWLFMRLFNQERSTGWAHHHIGGNNEHWIILAIGLVITLPALAARAYWRASRTRLPDRDTLLVVVLLLNPALVVLFFQSGKASLLPPRPGVFAEDFGCCSQAMVFPRAQVPSLREFLRGEGSGQVDLLLNKRAWQTGLTRYALYPVQAQHVGIDSARNTAKEEAQAIWSMAFEDLDPGRLQRDHIRMVEEYYGNIASGTVDE